MGIIDWIIVIGLALAAFHGWRRGLAAMLVRLGGAIAILLLVGEIFPLVKNALIEQLKLGLVPAVLLALVLIVVAAAVVLGVLERLFTKALKAVRLSWLNKLLGLALGLLNGLLVVMILMLLLDLFPRLSDPLKDGEKHRVYLGVDTFKEDVFTTLKFEQRERFQELREGLREDMEESQTEQ